MSAAVFGVQTPQTDGSDYNALQAVIQATLAKVQTFAICKVMGCTNSGGIAPAGTVDVQPLVNQMTGDRIAVPHGTIYKLPYARIQGGANAIIIDPVPGDLCMVGFAARDISAVVKAKGQANPGSFRQFNWADGMYIMGICNDTPTQYIAFTAAGIVVLSPTKITLHAPTVAVEGNLTISGTTTGQGDGIFNSTHVHTHVHSGVQSGGSDTGPPV